MALLPRLFLAFAAVACANAAFEAVSAEVGACDASSDRTCVAKAESKPKPTVKPGPRLRDLTIRKLWMVASVYEVKHIEEHIKAGRPGLELFMYPTLALVAMGICSIWFLQIECLYLCLSSVCCRRRSESTVGTPVASSPPPRPTALGAREPAPDLTAGIAELPGVDSLPSWHGQLAKIARERPACAALCVSATSESVTFGELHAWAEAFAAELRSGLPEDASGDAPIVGIAMERSAEFVAVLLAASRLGARSMPLPPDYPTERLRAVLSLARPAVVCTRNRDASFLEECCADGSCAVLRIARCDARPSLQENAPVPAWDRCGGVVLSSSGSTGVPKLIMRSERSFSHRLLWTWSVLPFREGEQAVQKSHMTTTHSLYELLEPLLAGASVHILPDVSASGVRQFWHSFADTSARRLLVVPSLLGASLELEEGGLIPETLSIITLMGEAPVREACERLLSMMPCLRLFSIYGCTEASSSIVVDIGSTLRPDVIRGDVSAVSESIPLGIPIHPSVRAHVLDDSLRPVVEPGQVGLLFLSGDQLFEGYLGAPDVTEASFPIREEARQLYYNTNDRVEILPGGALRHVGRADNVVKIRGNRVQLDEIEHHLLAFPGVRAACALYDDVADGLAALISPTGADLRELEKHLLGLMPPYMLPRVLALETLPVTTSGKTDRRALAQMLRSYSTLRQAAASTGSGSGDLTSAAGVQGVAASVRKVIQEVTGVEPRGDGERLASLGLDSISVLRLNARLQESLGARVPDMELLRDPTVEELARMMEHALRGGGEMPTDADMNLDALSGLRFVISLCVIRFHFDFHMPGLLQDTVFYDLYQPWRPHLFMLLAGMTMSIKYDRETVSVSRMFLTNGLQLFPVYLLGMAIMAPICYLPMRNCSLDLVRDIMADIFMLIGARVRVCCQCMSHCYYLTGHLLFIFCFNPIQRIVRWQLVGTRRTWGRVCLLVMAVNTFIFFSAVVLRSPYFCVFLLSYFIQGVITGQACLHIELGNVHAKLVAAATDVLALAILVQMCTPFTHWGGLSLRMAGFPVIMVLAFGICRTPCLTARLLSSHFLRFGEFSYVIYILHYPIIRWYKFIHVHRLRTVSEILSFDFRSLPSCIEDGSVTADPVPPLAWVGLFSFIVLVCFILTHSVHQPAQRAINRLGAWLRSGDF